MNQPRHLSETILKRVISDQNPNLEEETSLKDHEIHDQIVYVIFGTFQGVWLKEEDLAGVNKGLKTAVSYFVLHALEVDV